MDFFHNIFIVAFFTGHPEWTLAPRKYFGLLIKLKEQQAEYFILAHLAHFMWSIVFEGSRPN